MAAAVGFQGANALAILHSGRRPRWSLQTGPLESITATEGIGAPAALSDGVALTVSGEAAVVANVHIGLRANVGYRSALVTLTADILDTYTVTVNGTGMSDALPTSVDDCLIGLRDAILADAVVGGAAGANQVVTAECLDASGDVTTGTVAGGNAATSLRVWGATGGDNYEPDFSIAVSRAGAGAGTIACIADASTTTARLYGLPDSATAAVAGVAPGAWALINGTAAISLDYRGFSDRLLVAGYSSLYAEVDVVDGHAADGATVTLRMGDGIFIGPCILEG